MVDRILASSEYNSNFGDDTVPGDGRAGCVSPWLPVEQFYCRVLQRLVESDKAIAAWRDYLESHTVEDLVRFRILCNDFIISFVNGESDETLAGTLYDVLLGQAGHPGGSDYSVNEIGLFGWEHVVDRILASF